MLSRMLRHPFNRALGRFDRIHGVAPYANNSLASPHTPARCRHKSFLASLQEFIAPPKDNFRHKATSGPLKLHPIPTFKAQVKNEPSLDAADHVARILEASPATLFRSVDAGINALVNVQNKLLESSEVIKVIDRKETCVRTACDAIHGEVATSLREICVPSTTIALIGDTGAGKSSLINALLGYRSIAPSSGFGSATTAIPTEFHHRLDRPSGAPFLAELEYLSSKELDEEVKILLKDLSSRILEIHSHAEKLERNPEADAALEKLSAIFPELKLESLMPMVTTKGGEAVFDVDLAMEEVFYDLIDGIFEKKLGCTATKLHPDDEFESFPSPTVSLQADSEEDFAEVVRACVTQPLGTVDTSSAAVPELPVVSQSWPLIKSFKVFLNADILKNGLVLIDLPGRHDSSPSRSCMSEAYIDSADVTLIVTDCNRAVDSKSGSDLLQRRLEQTVLLDNRGNCDDVLIVCTKADSIDHDAAEREIPELRKKLLPVTTKLQEKIQKENELKKQVRELRSGIKVVGKANRTEKEHSRAKLERARDDLDQIMESISELKRFKNWSIIDSRNNYIKAKLSQKISSLISQHTGDLSFQENVNIPVFTVSSMEYQKFVATTKTNDIGFQSSSNYPQMEDTEIEKLRQHCTCIAVQRRIRGARQLFELKITSVIQALNLCLTLNEARSAFPEKFREVVSTEISKEIQALVKKVADDRKSTVGNIVKRAEKIKQLLRNSRDAVDKNAEAFNRSLRNTSQAYRRRGYTHASFKAIMARDGVFNDVNFNKELTEPMRNSLMKEWRNEVNAIKDCVKLWANHSSGSLISSNESLLKTLNGPLVLPAPTIQALTGVVNTRARTLVSDTEPELTRMVHGSFAVLHRVPHQTLMKYLKPTYHTCAEEIRGSGAFKAMAEKFGDNIIERDYYDRVFKEFDNRIDSIVEILEKRTAEFESEAVEMMKTNFLAIVPEASVGLQQQSEVAQEIMRECLYSIAQEFLAIEGMESGEMEAAPLLNTEKECGVKGKANEVNLLLGC